MKRLLLSVLGGFIVPFLIAVTTGPLSTYTRDRTINFWLDLPTGWPRILYFGLTGPLSPHPLANDETAFLIYIIGCDVLLYSMLTYAFLWMFSIMRRRELSYDQPPPPNS